MRSEVTKSGSISAVAYRGKVAMLALVLLAPLRVHADGPPQYGWREVWAGAQASGNVWLLYSGLTVAPHSHMFDDGLRLRITSGYGGYSYEGYRGGEPKPKLKSFKARTAFTDVLVGYLKRMGPLTAKGFLGASVISHDIRPSDPVNAIQGIEYGPKAVLELWLNMGSDTWSSLDVNWTSAYQTYSGQVRTGYRVIEDVSFGLEARIDGNVLDKDTRGGVFVRYEWQGGEISLAGGVAGQVFKDAKTMTTPYATATWLMQY